MACQKVWYTFSKEEALQNQKSQRPPWGILGC